MKDMKVSELMRRRVASIGPGEGLDAAAQLMREHDCGCLPVADEAGRVIGVLTDRDICMQALRTAKPLAAIRVAEAASQRAFTCRADDSIAEAERLMGQHQVRRLPVVDGDGLLAGILSLDDIAREAFREDELISRPVSARAVGITLGQIARPHLVRGPG